MPVYAAAQVNSFKNSEILQSHSSPGPVAIFATCSVFSLVKVIKIVISWKNKHMMQFLKPCPHSSRV